jgi:hypothetical protein
MDAETWLTLCKWAVVAGGLVATLGGVGVWYFEARVVRQRASLARPLVSVTEAPRAASMPAPESPVAPEPEGVRGAGRPGVPSPASEASQREVVRSLELRIAIEAVQPPGAVTETGADDGARNVVTLVLTDRTQLRFVSDSGFSDQRVGADRRRLTFTYRSETPGEILGRDVAVLGTVEVMAVDYRDVFRRLDFARDDEPTTLTLTVVLNGAEAGTLDQRGAPGLLGGMRAILDVSKAFGALRDRARP